MDDDDANFKTEIIEDSSVKNDLFAKVEIVGDLKVGKSAILKRLIQNIFLEEYKPTVGYEFNPYLVKVNDSVLKFQIWDMCGNDNYRSVLLNLYRNATLGILVYAINSRESFDSLEKWINQLKQYSLPDSKIILLGNKCDDEEHRQVSFEEGKMLCEKYDLELFMEISAKNGFSSPNFMEIAAIRLYKNYEIHKEDVDYSINLEDRNESIMLDKKENTRRANCC